MNNDITHSKNNNCQHSFKAVQDDIIKKYKNKTYNNTNILLRNAL